MMERIEHEVSFPRRISRREKREAERKRFRRKIKNFLIIFVTTFIMLGFLTVGIIRTGVMPGLQDFLVTSAMTTLSHRYIANIFASDAQIKAIMDNNKVVENYDKFDESKINEGIIDSKSDWVKLTDISKDGYTGYMLEISNPKRVFLGTSKQLGNYGTKIAQIVENYNALAGINAGGFSDENGKGRGGTPTGIIIENGEIKYVDNSIKKFSIIGFNKDNILVVGQYTLNEIENLGLRDAVAFRPLLIVNGKPTTMYGNGGWGIAPRTAIGQKEDGTVIMLVIDGRQVHSPGATMKQMQDIMLENGAVNAANLDGGSSSVMYFEGRIINSPSSSYGDRYLPSAFLINGDGISEGNVVNNSGK